MDLVVEVHRLPARLVTFDGEAVDADVFLRAGTKARSGPETLGDRLNDPSIRFLPCDIKGRVELVHLAWLAYVECAGALPEIEEHDELGAWRKRAKLRLVNGETLAGDLVYMLPSGSRRVSDLLNTEDSRFLLMSTPETTRYVHRRSILRVFS